jgi:hypothetical protein
MLKKNYKFTYIGSLFYKKMFAVVYLKKLAPQCPNLIWSYVPKCLKIVIMCQVDFSTIFHATWGRCYDHEFLRVSSIFGEKMAFFSKTNVMIKNYHNLALFWVKNAKFFGENVSKIITSAPGGRDPNPRSLNTGSVGSL